MKNSVFLADSFCGSEKMFPFDEREKEGSTRIHVKQRIEMNEMNSMFISCHACVRLCLCVLMVADGSALQKM